VICLSDVLTDLNCFVKKQHAIVDRVTREAYCVEEKKIEVKTLDAFALEV
jgi:hypothetical protein